MFLYPRLNFNLLDWLCYSFSVTTNAQSEEKMMWHAQGASVSPITTVDRGGFYA
jgi:hypothetical protein